MSDGNQTIPLEGGYTAPAAGTGAGRTNALAILSLVVGMLALILMPMCVVLGPVSLVLGGIAASLSIVARNQIGQRGQAGEELARAGLVLGIIALSLGLAATMLIIILTAIGSGVVSGLDATATTVPIP
jgi:hypothetical protein